MLLYTYFVTAKFKLDLFVGHTRTKNYTRGGTTTESHDKEADYLRKNAITGEVVNIIPRPLFHVRTKGGATTNADLATNAQPADSQADASASQKPEEKKDKKPKEVTESQQSGASSLLETSEDEE